MSKNPGDLRAFTVTQISGKKKTNSSQRSAQSAGAVEYTDCISA